jgi:7-cyano-7-deazaguanine synthase
VPARNTVFLSVALGWAEILGAQEIFLGVNAVDYSGYPDCRPEFLRAFEEMAQVATAAGTEKGTRIHIRAPLLNMDKAAIVRRAEELDVDLGLTHTCYDPVMQGEAALACGRCDACSLRLKGFAEADCTDPLSYAPLP